MQEVRPCRLWPLCSVRGRIIAGFALLVLILMGVVAGAAYLAREHRAIISRMERDAAVVSLLKDAKLNGALTLVLLQQYVISGDETIVPRMRSYWATGNDDLAKARDLEAVKGDQDMVAALNQLGTQAGPLFDAFEDIIARRESGDSQGAIAALAGVAGLMQPIGIGLDEAVTMEAREASAVTDRAGATSALAFWLLITSGAIGTVVALGSAAFVARSILKPLSSLEVTARAVTGGDLNTRAPTTGPRELAHLGITLNSMLAQLADREQDLRLANQELQERNHQLLDARAQAATDPLTGLLNHRAFHERIREEVDRARAIDARVSLVMLDIDNFKAVNDSLGHQAGDRILRDIALTLAEEVGVTGAYRYGGDEFALLLPGMDHRAAFRLGERLRALLRARADGHSPRVTVSMGVADFPSTAKSSDELIYGGDAAMYWAKSEGKDRVGRWGDLLRRRAQGTLPWYAADGAIREPDVVAALTAALAAKDPDTRAHTERCSWYAARLAEELGLNERETSIARLSSLLHDIGKLAVPDDILFKPGPLNEDEWAHMRRHPVSALHILGQVRPVAPAVPAILHHHEHFDGSGYPDGLAGQEIPIASRILLVTDAFDAMTTDRPYRKSLSVEAAVAELGSKSGSQFDPEIVAAFLRVLERHGAHPLCQMAAAACEVAAGSRGRSRRS